MVSASLNHRPPPQQWKNAYFSKVAIFLSDGIRKSSKQINSTYALNRRKRYLMKKTNLVTMNINGVTIQCTQEQAIAIATACGSATPATSKTSAKSSPAKSAPKKSKTSKVDELVRKFEPKAQDDNYHWGSYKAQRTKFVEAVTGKKDQWLPKEEYEKAAAPWVAYWGEYVKKADR